ncbi:predicted GPI-anchored protein 58 [Dermochelys coriacea]|uniref:predicted GPI-anchored protein 58 n=1 Tax=Dermochelys coriacea TaxID=27794 RepID=UPI0018E7A11E|nr:predicted GPI-anchored protein 58 [Dermochelys coriacea]
MLIAENLESLCDMKKTLEFSLTTAHMFANTDVYRILTTKISAELSTKTEGETHVRCLLLHAGREGSGSPSAEVPGALPSPPLPSSPRGAPPVIKTRGAPLLVAEKCTSGPRLPPAPPASPEAATSPNRAGQRLEAPQPSRRPLHPPELPGLQPPARPPARHSPLPRLSPVSSPPLPGCPRFPARQLGAVGPPGPQSQPAPAGPTPPPPARPQQRLRAQPALRSQAAAAGRGLPSGRYPAAPLPGLGQGAEV